MKHESQIPKGTRKQTDLDDYGSNQLLWLPASAKREAPVAVTSFCQRVTPFCSRSYGLERALLVSYKQGLKAIETSRLKTIEVH